MKAVIRTKPVLTLVVFILIVTAFVLPPQIPRRGAQSDTAHHLSSEIDSYLRFQISGTFQVPMARSTGLVKVNGVDHTIPLNPGQDVPSLSLS